MILNQPIIRDGTVCPEGWLLPKKQYRNLKQEIENDPVAGSEEYIAPDNGPIMQIRQYVQVLTERQREVVMLRIFEDMSVEDTAKVLGCWPGTVKAHLHKAITRLKEMAGDQAASGGTVL